MTPLRFRGGAWRRPPTLWVLLSAIAAVAVIAGSVTFALQRGGPGGSPAPGGAAMEPDKPPLAADGTISEKDLAHDSRDDLYRMPGGAIPAGKDVTLRLRAAAGDLTAASIRVYDGIGQSQIIVPMSVEARDATGGEHGYDYWSATLHTLAQPTVLYYRFIVRDGPTTRYLEDDAALDGGSGTVLATSADASWQIDTYDPQSTTPGWASGAVVYQIFPDRFANGNPANDPTPTAVQGSSGADRFRYGDVYGNPILVKDWNDLPEGYCRAYQHPAVPCTEQPLGRDFYGGDLAGITEHLPDLADLGVTVLYLNPIFAAPSNHRYDTSDYFTIDPDLGTQQDFETLVSTAHSLGMKVILDGVFNHTSSDSPYFDRAHRYVEVGACESAGSPYAAWYTLKPGPPAKCYDGQTYEDWFGFDTLPVLTEDPDVFALINGPQGVVRHWLALGADGWRLDVMNEISHGFLKGLRRAALAEDPNALIIGELWDDASPWILGNEADTTMNYRFRRAVIGLVNGDTADLDGAIAGLTPSAFASTIESVQEDYPPQAFATLLNLVDSHDTTRILWTLTPGAENREAKEDPAAMAIGKKKLRTVAAIQFTFPGMADIYYGDEVGLTGQDDPDDRRTYPWGSEDLQLRDAYRQLAHLRTSHASLRSGDLRFLLADDAANVLAYGRKAAGEAAVVAVNLGDGPQTVRVPVAGYLPDGTALAGALLGSTTSVRDGAVEVTLPAGEAEVLITGAGADLAAPGSATGLTASPAAGAVSLAWAPVDGAASYTVWRSVVNGGYVSVGTATTTSFTDRTARSGVRYHYVVTAADAAGNAGPRSTDATALPELTVADARIDSGQRVSQPLTATGPGSPIGVRVRVDGVSGAAGPSVGIAVEVGFGPAGSDPSSDAWTWVPAAYDADVEGADHFAATVRPEELGEHAAAARISTSGGERWTYVGLDGMASSAAAVTTATVVSTPSSDTQAPPPPQGLAAASVSTSQVTLTWEPVTAADLLRYEVLRSSSAGGPFERVGTAVEPTFTDADVSGGGTYHYQVLAVDTSFNRSEPSAAITTAAQSRPVNVTFTVTTPANTPPGDTIYIAGDFQGWAPGATPMQRVDDHTWTITLPFTENQQPQYKYTRGSWEKVEKDTGCGEIPNRTTTVTYGSDGTMAVTDTVGKWRDVDQCG